jgi:putative AlgH/UPF0301 family transcriptional regulator
MTKAAVCLLFSGALACAQDFSAGKILVASRQSHDADFAQTVILVVRHDRQATIGLFVNRPLNVPLTEVYPELKQGQLKLYAGGPFDSRHPCAVPISHQAGGDVADSRRCLHDFH